jgi:hypothetical protein
MAMQLGNEASELAIEPETEELSMAIPLMKISAALAVSFSLFATAAQASFPPKKWNISREKVAETCDALGADGRGFGLDTTSGKYGCENLASGSTLICEESGECKYYFYDPRAKWFKKDPNNPGRIIVIPPARAA